MIGETEVDVVSPLPNTSRNMITWVIFQIDRIILDETTGVRQDETTAVRHHNHETAVENAMEAVKKAVEVAE